VSQGGGIPLAVPIGWTLLEVAMKITLYAHLFKTVKSPKKLDRMSVFYDIEVMAVPRIGEKVCLNGMQDTYDDSIKQEPFYLGDCYEDGATVFEVEHNPFTDQGVSVSVEVSEVDSRQIIDWFKRSNARGQPRRERKHG
jgi:hypothetical protein